MQTSDRHLCRKLATAASSSTGPPTGWWAAGAPPCLSSPAAPSSLLSEGRVLSPGSEMTTGTAAPGASRCR